MANYIIIGGDKKEYGPVSEADVRQWITEGRLNGTSLIKAESDAEFRALALYPEFAEVLKQQAVATAQLSTPAPVNFWDRDYELDLGGCISRGFGLMKENFGLVFGTFVLVAVIFGAANGAVGIGSAPINKSLMEGPVGLRLAYNIIISCLLALVLGPLMGGLYLVYLKKIRGLPTGIGEVFAGFQQAFLQLFLVQLVVGLFTQFSILPAQYVFWKKAGPLLAQMQQMQNDPAGLQNLMPQFVSAMTNAIPVSLICIVPATFFTVSFLFALPLVIDKQMNCSTALKTSWHMVMKHWWQVLGLTILVALISGLGLLGCCVGVLFTAPIGLAATMFAYETIFGAQKN